MLGPSLNYIFMRTFQGGFGTQFAKAMYIDSGNAIYVHLR